MIKIEEVNNGFIVTVGADRFVAATLDEALKLVSENYKGLK